MKMSEEELNTLEKILAEAREKSIASLKEALKNASYASKTIKY